MTDWNARMQEAMRQAKANTDARIEAERQADEVEEARRLAAEANRLHRQVAKVLEAIGDVEECASAFGHYVAIHGKDELKFPSLPPHATNFVSLGLCHANAAFVVVAVRQTNENFLDRDCWAEIYSFEYSETMTHDSVRVTGSNFVPVKETERVQGMDAGILAIRVGDVVIELAAARHEAMRMGTAHIR